MLKNMVGRCNPDDAIFYKKIQGCETNIVCGSILIEGSGNIYVNFRFCEAKKEMKIYVPKLYVPKLYVLSKTCLYSICL